MRIPKGRTLEAYIKQLIAEDRIIEFYKSDDWEELRADVLQELHNECQECLKRGRVTRADCVHHVKEVRQYPALALSRTYTDATGQEQRQLVPLCNTCHNKVHDKLGKWQRKGKYSNKERW